MSFRGSMLVSLDSIGTSNSWIVPNDIPVDRRLDSGVTIYMTE